MKQRLIRILVYEGSPEWIAQCIATRGIKGSKIVSSGTIREAIVGDFLAPILDEPPQQTQPPVE